MKRRLAMTRRRPLTKKSAMQNEEGQTASVINSKSAGPILVVQSNRLTRDFFEQDCLELSKALLGKVLVRRLSNGDILRATIVETEAYPGGDDAASQSFQGRRTERNEPMYMSPGTTYVYFTYGMYHCFNISSKGDGSAVLIRGAEPKEEYEIMHQLRTPKSRLNGQSAPKKQLKPHELCNGPSKLCMAFDMTRHNCNKIDMVTSNEIWLEVNDDVRFHDGNFVVETAKRIGIDSTPPVARNKPWRFYIADNFSVSKVSVAQIRKRLAQKEEAQDN